MGAPSVYFVLAVPQDGIASPADFNAHASRSTCGASGTAPRPAGAGTLTGPDASGYYTVTLTGVDGAGQRGDADRRPGLFVQRDERRCR